MTKDAAIAETKYRIAKCVFTSLQENGLISDDELNTLLIAAVEKYHPLIGELEVNSIAREKGYTG